MAFLSNMGKLHISPKECHSTNRVIFHLNSIMVMLLTIGKTPLSSSSMHLPPNINKLVSLISLR